MKKIKKYALNIGLAVISIIIISFFAEIFLRIFYKDDLKLFPRYTTQRIYGDIKLRTLIPNLEFWHTSVDGSWKFTTNEQGFRSKTDYKYENSDNKLRILCLGDSQTQGYEVRQDYTFPEVLNRYLNAKGISSEVLNTGISGFSTAEELLFLENEGIKYKPDVVVLAFFANDYYDNSSREIFMINPKGELILKKKEFIPGVKVQNIVYSIPFVKWLTENSYFFSFLSNSAYNLYKNGINAESPPVDSPVEYTIPMEQEYSDFQINLTSKLLIRISDFCSNNNINLILVDIPVPVSKNSFKSSITDSLYKAFTGYSDEYLLSTEILADYEGAAMIHVEHGERHISEFTHTVIGMEIGKKIRTLIK